MQKQQNISMGMLRRLCSTCAVNCRAIATVRSVLPPSTTINSSPGARVTPLRVAERWSCSLRVGTITEMREAGGGVIPALALAIMCDVPRQQ